MERVWHIWSNNRGRYAVAKEPSGEFIVHMAGPMTWDEATAWMRGQGVPGW
jgi:hypothetical protein